MSISPSLFLRLYGFPSPSSNKKSPQESACATLRDDDLTSKIPRKKGAKKHVRSIAHVKKRPKRQSASSSPTPTLPELHAFMYTYPTPGSALIFKKSKLMHTYPRERPPGRWDLIPIIPYRTSGRGYCAGAGVSGSTACGGLFSGHLSSTLPASMVTTV